MVADNAHLQQHLQQSQQQIDQLEQLFARQREAFRANPMPSAEQRIQWLKALSQMLSGNQEALIKAINQDFSNRSADETLLAEIMPSLQGIHYASSRIKKWMKPSRRSVGMAFQPAAAKVIYQPLGVVGVIVPWNYPMIMAAWKIAPALAAGNSVVLKPSEKSPLTALRLAELAIEAGIPPGVFNIVPGYGPEAGSPLALHMDVDCIGFTGSTRVGKQIHVMAGQSNLKRAWTELGGKSPNIVFADCPDLDKAVEAAVGSIFFNQGESCNAPSRLFVEASIQEQFLEKAVAMAPKFAPANPLLPDTIMGAIVDKTQMDTVLRYVESGKAQGASLLYGGEQAMSDSGGCYVQPTIFAGVKPEMKICCEEIFGPVLSVMPFTDAAEVVRQANASIYGLQAAVWTRDINRAHGIARALRAGTVHVNQYDEDDITVPFGGYKQSGVGRDKSLHAFDKYTETKTTWIRIDSPV